MTFAIANNESKRCGNCAHWGIAKHIWGDDRPGADCRGRLPCAVLNNIGDGRAITSASAAYVEVEGYEWNSAELWTMVGFHCALWTPKDEPR